MSNEFLTASAHSRLSSDRPDLRQIPITGVGSAILRSSCLCASSSSYRSSPPSSSPPAPAANPPPSASSAAPAPVPTRRPRCPWGRDEELTRSTAPSPPRGMTEAQFGSDNWARMQERRRRDYNERMREQRRYGDSQKGKEMKERRDRKER